MDLNLVLIGLAGVLASAAPIIFASIGETLNERAGVINLALDGMILLSAMAAFAAAFKANSLVLGFVAAMGVGALVALIVAFSSITLRQSQVAVGFVLTLMCRDLAYFLGNPFVRQPGPSVPPAEIPILSQIPILGPLFFHQNLVTYLSFILIFLVWVWIFKTQPGLRLRGVGERPAAAFIRGANVNLVRYTYTVIGGSLVGFAGAAYSLSVKLGWGRPQGAEGTGWIALAIVIFGGWHPFRVAFGAYLFALLQWLGLVLQPSLPGVPSQVLQVAPFPLMILTLLLVNLGNAEWVDRTLARLPTGTQHTLRRILRALQASPPAALGTTFSRE
jgi:ABC-type uncharacterized transport system permease subunit